MLNLESVVRKASHFVGITGTTLAVRVICGVWILSPALITADEIQRGWMSNYHEAEVAAKTASVPLIIHFWAPWCGPCRKMEAEVLAAPEVTSMLGKGIIGVKVNADDHRDLVSRFGVTALPTDVFVSTDGTVLSSSVGSPGRQGYIAKISQLRVNDSAKSPDLAPQPSSIAAQEKSTGPVVQTVTAAKPVLNDSPTKQPGKAIVGLSVVSNEAPSSKTSPSEAQADDPRPVARNKALHSSDGLQLGLNGYSPVLLSDNTKWQKGDPHFAINVQGVRYLLTSAEEKERFESAPEKYVPALHGCDPVSLVNDQVVQSGFVELGATFRSRTYFFTTNESRNEFLRNPEKFATAYHLAFFETAEEPSEPAVSAEQPSATSDPETPTETNL